MEANQKKRTYWKPIAQDFLEGVVLHEKVFFEEVGIFILNYKFINQVFYYKSQSSNDKQILLKYKQDQIIANQQQMKPCIIEIGEHMSALDVF